MLISGAQQSDSVIHVHIFSYLFHYDLLQDIEYSSLCYTVEPCCLSILYIIVFKIQSLLTLKKKMMLEQLDIHRPRNEAHLVS